jgi:dihydroxyacid dehydratase/phosphogluconate dehydratase
LLHCDVLTVTGNTLGENLDWWEKSERRRRFRELLQHHDSVQPDEVILSPDTARACGMTGTLVFPRGNLAPEGAVVKATAIDPRLFDADGIYQHEGPARVFVNERDAMAAIKGGRIHPGDVLVLTGVGPMGTGMEETYQVTGALKYLPHGRNVALLTDARFSGVSTGACVGHIGPEGLAGGPIGKVLDGDIVRIVIDRRSIQGNIDLVGTGGTRFGPDEGKAVLTQRVSRGDLAPNAALPADTKLWAVLQFASGGTWAGCVYDPEKISAALQDRPTR